jgi:hypothetical protein
MPLSCPQPANYAAIAKQMHQTALEAETRIFDLEHLLRSAVNRPTIVQVSTSAITGIPVNSEWNIGTTGGADFSTLFNNTSVQFADNTDAFEVLGDGVYEVGLYANMSASGAVNVSSSRYFSIFHNRPDPIAVDGLTRVTEASQHLSDPNAGVGVDGTLSALFRVQRQDRLAFSVFHTNTSSTVNVPVGTLV